MNRIRSGHLKSNSEDFGVLQVEDLSRRQWLDIVDVSFRCCPRQCQWSRAWAARRITTPRFSCKRNLAAGEGIRRHSANPCLTVLITLMADPKLKFLGSNQAGGEEFLHFLSELRDDLIREFCPLFFSQ